MGHLTSVDFCLHLHAVGSKEKASPKWGSLDANRGTRILILGGNIYIHFWFIHTYHFIHCNYNSASRYSKLWEYTWVALLRSLHAMKCLEASFQAVQIHR